MKRILLIVFCIISCKTDAFDLSHPFHAQFKARQPFFEKAYLTSGGLRAAFGSTRKRNDACGIPRDGDCEDRYSIQAFVFDATHTFCRGFFVSATLPIYHFKITEKPLHREFWSAANLCLTGGWTLNYQEFEQLDFMDVTLETGFVAATAEKPWNAWGIPLRGVISWGVYDWMTAGLAADIVGFFTPHNGRLWDVSWFLEADHVIRGLSCYLGYTHSNQTQTPLPWSCEILPFWTMDTFHFSLSYDSACLAYPFLPCAEFFFNHVMSGKNILQMPLWGFGLTTHF